MKKQNEVETLEEKIRNSDVKITNRKFTQEFISLFEEQRELFLELERYFKERYEISGRGKIIAILCRFMFSEIEKEAKEMAKKDGK
ncbi:MAG: hypothetical protein UR66_C0010G0041 [Candidatus Moranbacteria bacterium GW2011_GWE1_35_17]|nr:MAG: hypothetical protein UR66_C0010G0041 [Candidatus Moranbacteria bacterium GW2011_GWE1_35_17]KKP83879.1 MAG: hypothetical protein UR82_C0017G0009 [Candidatus Moranbacteria bacterium GW2011_GWF1_35_5]